MSGFAQWGQGVAGDRLAAVVRPAASDDVASVNHVQIESGRQAFSVAGWASAVGDEERAVIVAEHAEGVVGWASTFWHPRADGAAGAGHYLSGVTVSPAFRRRGIAGLLIGERLRWIAERADEAWYFANARNLVSIRAHARFGFQEAGRRSSVHGVDLDGGEGVVFRVAPLRGSPSPAAAAR